MENFDHPLLKIPARVREWSKPLGIVTSLLMVGFIGLTDYLTGPELSLSILYLLPVSFAVLAAGGTAGLAIAVVSAATWLLADLTAGSVYSHPLIPYWNAAVRLGYFGLHTLLLVTLLALIEKMELLGLRDSLTGAANWRYFQEVAQRELEIHRRTKQQITVVYADLDNFKTANDTLGHDAGNEILRTTVEVIQSHVRPGDLVARVGGDEFALLFPNADHAGAHVLLTRVRSALREEFQRNGWPISVSMGAVTFRALPSTVDVLVKRADELMYQVKKDGKDNLLHKSWPAA